MNRCLQCRKWYEPAKDSSEKEINPTYCEDCLK